SAMCAITADDPSAAQNHRRRKKWDRKLDGASPQAKKTSLVSPELPCVQVSFFEPPLSLHSFRS
ncbi:MAG: hypothetical protein ACRD19_10955, partial [Terriglobia bacterium]